MRELSSNYLSKRGKKYHQISLILQIIIYLKNSDQECKTFEKKKKKKESLSIKGQNHKFWCKVIYCHV